MNRKNQKPFESTPRNRIFNLKAKKATSGQISEIIDFNMKGKSRYMKINQPVNNKLRMSGTRSSNLFRNPRLSTFDFDGEEEYEPKQFVFDIIEYKVDPAPSSKPSQPTESIDRDPSQDKKRNYDRQRIKRAISLRNDLHRSRRSHSKDSLKNKIDQQPKSHHKHKDKDKNHSSKISKLTSSQSTIKLTGKTKDKNKEAYLNQMIDEKKVDYAIELIERALAQADLNNRNSVSIKETSSYNSFSVKNTQTDDYLEAETNGKQAENESSQRTSTTVDDEQEWPSQVIEEEKLEYFKEKKIQVNTSIDDNADTENLTQKPIKTNVATEAYATENKRQLKSACTQTKKDASLDFITDRLQYTESATSYVNTLIDDVQKIFDKNEKEKNENQSNELHKVNDLTKNFSINKIESNSSRSSSQIGDSSQNGQMKYTNSLGLAMEGKHGVNMAIIKGKVSAQYNGDINGDSFETNDHLLNSVNEKNTQGSEQILLKKNYQNLEDLISETMLTNDNDSHYLMIAKLNRLKVLMELSMKMVGRTYQDISNEERSNLELEANRFHTTFPLPGEELLSEETNEKGEKQLRMPIKIVQVDGLVKIDLNNFYQIEPNDFLQMYTRKLFNHAQESTGLKFDNVTVAIPAAYGTQQREAIKNSLNKASNRDDVQILTRSVAAVVVLNNKRDNDVNRNKSSSSLSSQTLPETYKLVFDMTEGSMDASVIRIKDSKDFHAISNVGDTSFGIHDVDERILAHIINEKSLRSRVKRRQISLLDSNSAYDLETVNAYANLIKNIKQNIVENGAVTVDLAYIDETSNREEISASNNHDELFIDKRLIYDSLCRDIYDWSLAHIEKAIIQADVNDRDIDEIIMIGDQHKMPGFYEYLRHAYPYKQISYVKEEDLAVGASIVGRKLKYQQIKITEVLCRSIGIGLYTGVITYLLFRNASLPVVGGCVYSTLVDDQESMVLDIYEGERPHIKFSRYLGEVTVYDLPRGRAGTVKCEVYLKMNNEGLLEVKALDLNSGTTLKTQLDANPEHLTNSDQVNDNTELHPIEAERFKKQDYDLVYALEKLDEHLEDLNSKYRSHSYSKFILEKIFDTKEWMFKHRRTITLDECYGIRAAIDKFLVSMESLV